MRPEPITDAAVIISSDGHAMATMLDYRPYLPEKLHDDFDHFYHGIYSEMGARNADARALARHKDPDIVERWSREVIDRGRLDGISDPYARVREQDKMGCVAEVLFPDFGLPFEIGGMLRSSTLRYERTRDQIVAANKAHNRWLADYCSTAPDRFAGLAVIDFTDVEDAVSEIRWAKEAGLRGILLPHFDDYAPVYDSRFEPIWNTVVELGMPVNCHAASSSVSTRPFPIPAELPHPITPYPLLVAQVMFFSHQVLHHMIWGGVLERHPELHVVFTEQGSGWVVGELQGMDYSYEHSYLRKDIHDLVRRKPSEYFARQCSLGSSIFSLYEVKARHEIGLEKMALGLDYPHHEGAWAAGPGTLAYLKATLGAAEVPESEARKLLHENAVDVWGFDLAALGPIAARVGPSMRDILTPPLTDEYPRGDVRKPAGAGLSVGT